MVFGNEKWQAPHLEELERMADASRWPVRHKQIEGE